MISLVLGMLGPVVVSAAIAGILLRVLPRDAAPRWAGALAAGIAFFAGYALLETGDLRPASSWQWLPWLALATALVGPAGVEPRLHIVVRITVWAILVVAAAWLIVPTWKSLSPSRSIHIGLFSGTTLALTVLLELLAKRASAPVVLTSLAVSAACGGALIAALISFRIGLPTLAAAMSLTGVWVWSLRDESHGLVRGVTLFYAVVVGGLLLAGQLQQPRLTASFLLVLMAPLALWMCEILPLRRVRGIAGVAVRGVAVLVPLAAAIFLAVLWTE